MSHPLRRIVRKLIGPGLKARFVAIFVVMILGIVSILAIYFITTQRDMLRTEQRNRALGLVKNLAFTCGYPVLLEDLHAMRQLAMGIMNEEDVAFVLVRDRLGGTLVELTREAVSLGDELKVKALSQCRGSEHQCFEVLGFSVVHAPIFKPSDEDLTMLQESSGRERVTVIGSAVIGISPERMQKLIILSIKSTVAITAVIAIIGILAALVVVHYLMAPLMSMMRGTRELAGGNLEYRVPPCGDNELGTLARSFNEMAGKLSESKKALDDYSRDLEEMVRKRTAELIHREAELNSILENNPAGIILVDADTRMITWANTNALRLLNGSREQVEGSSAGKCFMAEQEIFFARALAYLSSETFEGRLRALDGSELPVLESISKVTFKGRQHLLHAFFDITEYKRLEYALLQAQKMGAIGTLAGGIAHDFNNLLQAILGCTQIALMKGQMDEIARNHMIQVEKSVERGSELIKQLMTFSRKVESQLRPLDLNHEIEKLVGLISRTFPRRISIEKNLSANLNKINGDSVQIEQVLMNLAVNARDAMPQGGQLCFRTSNARLDEEVCRGLVGVEPGEYVLLSVSDTGHGMGEETLARLYEPFFTTKEVGKGTGLGLAMVYGIIKGHRGHIVCSTTRDRGTTFDIYLPVSTGGVCATTSCLELSVEARGGEETILLVDDDEDLLQIGQDALSDYGYNVVTAARGDAALEILTNRRGEIQVVLLDLSMPGMGGDQCAQEMLKIDPEVKIIIASGYADTAKQKDLLANGATSFIGKPYQLDEMLKRVRHALDGA